MIDTILLHYCVKAVASEIEEAEAEVEQEFL